MTLFGFADKITILSKTDSGAIKLSTNHDWQQLFSAADTIHSKYGSQAIETENLVKNLLADLAPDCTNESAALTSALSNQNIRYIISNENIGNIDYLIYKLQETFGLSDEWSQNIAICIFKLQGKQETPQAPEKDTNRNQSAPPPTPPATTKRTETPEQRLISSGYGYLRNGKWDKANDRFDQSLKTAQYPRAYIGKLMAKLQISLESDLPFTNYDILNDPLWQSAMQKAYGRYKTKLERYAREHKDYISKKIKKPANKKRRKATLAETILSLTGITFIFIAVAFGFSIWFTSMSDYSFVEYIMTIFTCAAMGEGFILLSDRSSNTPVSKRVIRFFAVSIGVPLGVIALCFIIDFAIPIVSLLFA